MKIAVGLFFFCWAWYWWYKFKTRQDVIDELEVELDKAHMRLRSAEKELRFLTDLMDAKNARDATRGR